MVPTWPLRHTFLSLYRPWDSGGLPLQQAGKRDTKYLWVPTGQLQRAAQMRGWRGGQCPGFRTAQTGCGSGGVWTRAAHPLTARRHRPVPRCTRSGAALGGRRPAGSLRNEFPRVFQERLAFTFSFCLFFSWFKEFSGFKKTLSLFFFQLLGPKVAEGCSHRGRENYRIFSWKTNERMMFEEKSEIAEEE